MVVAVGCSPPGMNGTGGGAGGGGRLGGGFGGSGGGSTAGGGGTGGAGGGATGGGAAGGGAAGGVGGGGGGANGAGIVNFDTFAFFNPAMISGADGVLHLVFNTNTSPSEVHYARCASDCGVGTNWSAAIVGTGEFTGSTRLVIGTDNRLHLLYEASRTAGARELLYATCANNCIQSTSWTKTDLASIVGFGWSSPSNGSPLVIDAQNRLTFTVDRKIYSNGGVTLGTCASNCTDVTNWSAGNIRANGTRTVLAARGTTLHQLIDDAPPSSGDARSLAYRTCAGNCTQEASWQELPDLFFYDGQKPLAIAVTAQGGVRAVYNQGITASTEPPQIKAQDDKMLVWGCETNCLQRASWTGFITGAVGDGAKGISLAEQAGSMVIAITNDDRVFARYCGDNCLTDTNWLMDDVDTSLAVTAAYDPFTFVASTCSGNRPLSATWHLSQGVVAIRPDGSAAFTHAASVLRTCPGSAAVVYIPGYGRLVYVP